MDIVDRHSDPEPWYYLKHFYELSDWVSDLYQDLLSVEQQIFIDRVMDLPRPAAALLVRMHMRKGEYFRLSRLTYDEIGPPEDYLTLLSESGLIEVNPPLDTPDFCQLASRAELSDYLGLKGVNKREMIMQLTLRSEPAAAWSQRCPESADQIIRLTMQQEFEIIQMLYFGNWHQSLTEFVLAGLGKLQYEMIEVGKLSRPFTSQQDINCYVQLNRCRLILEETGQPDQALEWLPALFIENHWLNSKISRAYFRLARAFEKQGDPEQAIILYAHSNRSGSRFRIIRILESGGEYQLAWQLWQQWIHQPSDELEAEQLLKMGTRLASKNNAFFRRVTTKINQEILVLQQKDLSLPIEIACCNSIHTDQNPVYYVENGLLCSLFGLWAWDALYANVPGAFFHPFQSCPADISDPEFYHRRQHLFADLWKSFDNDTYVEIIREHYLKKQNLTNSFVDWKLLSDELVDLSLNCISAEIMQVIFKRILENPLQNRSGLPDLVRFLPQAGSAEFIEVKGPGDQLQINQSRWLEFFGQHGISAKVIRIQYVN